MICDFGSVEIFPARFLQLYVSFRVSARGGVSGVNTTILLCRAARAQDGLVLERCWRPYLVVRKRQKLRWRDSMFWGVRPMRAACRHRFKLGKSFT